MLEAIATLKEAYSNVAEIGNKSAAQDIGEDLNAALIAAGRANEVVMLEDGVLYEGETYGSLSEVARLITGQRWNGPRFFGLRRENVR